MKCFKIERIDNASWCEDFEMVVIAKDEPSAEILSRLSSDDFKKAKLKVTEINIDVEQVVLVANIGA